MKCPYCKESFTAFSPDILSGNPPACPHCNKRLSLYISWKRMLVSSIPLALLYALVFLPLMDRLTDDISNSAHGIIFLTLLCLAGISYRGERENQVANKFMNKDVSKMKLLVISIVIFSFSVFNWGLGVLMLNRLPEKSDLSMAEGRVVSKDNTAKGKPEYLFISSNDKLIKLQFSVHIEEWSGIKDLTKGDYVEVLYDDGFAGRTDKDDYTPWIWQLKRGDKTLLDYDEIRKRQQRSDNEFNSFALKFILISAVLLILAYARHRKNQKLII